MWEALHHCPRVGRLAVAENLPLLFHMGTGRPHLPCLSANPAKAPHWLLWGLLTFMAGGTTTESQTGGEMAVQKRKAVVPGLELGTKTAPREPPGASPQVLGTGDLLPSTE